MMKCMTCPKSAAWHRSQIEQLEQTIGPMAGHYGYDSTNCPDCRIAQIGIDGLVRLSAFGA
jgi:hypothetical protein